MGTAQTTLDSASPHVAKVAAEFRNDDGSGNGNDIATTAYGFKAQYALGLVKTFIDESTQQTFARAIRIDLLQSHLAEVHQIDIGIADGEQAWESVWARLLTTIEPCLIAKMAADKTSSINLRRKPAGTTITTNQPSDAGAEADPVSHTTSVADLYNISDAMSLPQVQYWKARIQAAVWEHYLRSVPQWSEFIHIHSEDKKNVIVAAKPIPGGTTFPIPGEIVVRVISLE